MLVSIIILRIVINSRRHHNSAKHAYGEVKTNADPKGRNNLTENINAVTMRPIAEMLGLRINTYNYDKQNEWRKSEK